MMRSLFLIGAPLLAALVLAPLAPVGAEPGVMTDKTAAPVTGQEVYTQVCQACHMADGKGGSGAATILALADNPRLQVAEYPITMVVHGRGAMPYFTDTLTPAQVAAVVTYVRTNFGNHYAEPVTEAEVKALWVPAPKAEH
jgi:mono/diheme cytochrome c family protein